MRARNTKPGLFQNEQLAELPFEARWLFVGLPMLADREGRLEDRPKRIKMQIFPADSVDVEPLLQGLVEQGLIVRYEVDGNKCIWIPKFHKHQKPHNREVPSVLPPPPGQKNKYNHAPVTKEQRNRILERDQNACQFCGETKNLHIDHVMPVAAGGTSEDENLQVLCGPCNIRKSNKVNYEVSQDRNPVRVDSVLSEKSKSVALNPESLILNPESIGGRKKTARKTRLPADWELPDDWLQWAADNHPKVDAPREAEVFRDHWIAKGETRASWKAAWNNWIRRAEKFNAERGNSSGKKLSALERVQRATGGARY